MMGGDPRESALTPVFAALSAALHLLIAALLLLAAFTGTVHGGATGPSAIVLDVILAVFAVTYVGGVVRGWAAVPWLAALTTLWLAALTLSGPAVYLGFALSFLYMGLLPIPAAIAGALLSAGAVSAAVAVREGLSAAVVIGPLFGAGVAVVVGLGHRALYREAAERRQLIAELVATRSALGERSREAGVLAERTRLAAELHDTVAQGLASIQMLLHAVERGLPDEHSEIPSIRLARETAAENLAETRRIIVELRPAALEGESLAGALGRLCDRVAGPAAEFVLVGDQRVAPMAVEAALLRIAQGAVGNVLAHADAGRVVVTLTYEPDEIRLDVVDDGRGFDPAGVDPGAGSFGLEAIRRRVGELGGSLVVESAPGRGAALSVTVPVVEETEDSGASEGGGIAGVERGEGISEGAERNGR